MKKAILIFLAALPAAHAFTQPILRADSLQPGLSFTLYALSGLNGSNLAATGPNVSWDISSATATVAGTAELQSMASNPYASTYPTANFAIKFTTGATVRYSLFHMTSAILEEVANNVGSSGETSFSNPRTTLVFPFTFTNRDTDVYQKTGQGNKSIINQYDSYGSMITSQGTYSQVARNLINDDGNTSANFWNVSPLFPLFQASGSNFTLWKINTGSTGFAEQLNASYFDVYPNPAANQLSLLNSVPLSRIEIMDLSGKLLLLSTQSQIDISSLPCGMYVVRAYSDKGICAKKFIKQN